MKVFLANIGNRNLKWEETYPPTESFKAVTEAWEQEFEQKKAGFSLQIIPELLQTYGPYDRIILVGTTTNHYQDTLHSARIVQRLLPTCFPWLSAEQVEVMQLKEAITQDEYVFNFYRGQLLTLLNKHGHELELHVCDAGGTPQQKLAMKIMADFMLEPEQLKVLYINQQKQASEVSLTSYRNLFTGQALLRLIDTGAYRAALVLRNREGYLFGQGGKNKADKLIRLGHYLVNNQWPPELKKDWVSYFPKEPTLIASLLNENPCLSLNPFPGEQKTWFLCAQNYYLARFFLQQKEFARAVLCFTSFYEKLFNELARVFIGWDASSKKKRGEFEQALANQVNQSYPEQFQPFVPGIPHFSRLALLLTTGQVKEAIAAIIEHLLEFELTWNEAEQKMKEERVSKPEKLLLLDELRNAFAHEGRILSSKEEKYLEKEMGALLDKLADLLGWNGIEQIPELNHWITIFLKENPN